MAESQGRRSEDPLLGPFFVILERVALGHVTISQSSIILVEHNVFVKYENHAGGLTPQDFGQALLVCSS